MTYDDNGEPIQPEQCYDLSKKDIRFAIDEEESPLVEPKPFDPASVDHEDADQRAVQVLMARYATAADG